MSIAQLFMEVLETRCELVDYTKCDWDKSLVPVRDDKVSSSLPLQCVLSKEYFFPQTEQAQTYFKI